MTQQYAFFVGFSGNFRLLDWPTIAREQIETVSAALDCEQLAPIDITGELTMWLDNGLDELPLNIHAMRLYRTQRRLHRAYYGDAIFTGGLDEKGRRTGLTEDQALAILEVLLNPTIPQQRTRD
ncbi:hypothetical protein ACFV2X_48120 [Streptomyces sp. NPDC059679]|uniref:DUF3846 domain-containing protein n=1 Tax=Streptomyces sp. NPDC059679 TaxID=3346903 RepID=UPI0036C44D52